MTRSSSSILRFSQFGPYRDVLRLEEEPVREPAAGEVLIAMQRASINPADFNLIEGTYGIKPTLPAVAGVEGFGVVEEVGAGVHDFRPGDVVRPPSHMGMWRQWVTVPAHDCLPLPKNLSPEQTACLYVNPPTAWRMIHDFAHLLPGDWIVQNAANSAVGRCVIQIARHLNLRTANIVRRAELKQELAALGADVVATEEETAAWRNQETPWAEHAPKLALNAVGGESALRLAKLVAPNGYLVTYGGMSRQPFALPTGLLIFKNVHVCGFWMTRWYQQANRQDIRDMLEILADLMRSGVVQIPIESTYPLSEFLEALERASATGRSGKVLFDLHAG